MNTVPVNVFIDKNDRVSHIRGSECIGVVQITEPIESPPKRGFNRSKAIIVIYIPKIGKNKLPKKENARKKENPYLETS